MAGQKFKSARAIATEVLNRCDPKKNYAGTILDEVRHQTDQGQRATDLVFGTLRNRGTIDTVIATFSGRPVKRIQGRLLNIIRVGTYELIYCPSTEQYAIVNEAVAIAKTAGSDKQAGFVNAVLRQITRHIINRQTQLNQMNAGCTLPQTPATGCQFDTDFLPDSKSCPAEYLSTVFSLPQWLITGWLDEL
ncbi:MAG: transcription antitermination protein NusB, partial [Planctomycetota bacterium]